MVARVVLLGALAIAAGSGFVRAPAAQAPGWTLIWSDEFNDRDGSKPNPTRWTSDVGGNGWGNQELQYYTDRTPRNSVIQRGNLAISALAERYTGRDGVTRPFTSARIHTLGRFTVVYGRIEARIRVPSGQGLWPAFWMLGSNINEVGWPNCGEIDILENVGSEPSTIHGTLHGPGYSDRSGIGGSYTLPGNRRFTDAFHVFAIEWEPNVVRFSVDGALYKTLTPADLPRGAVWIFDRPFFLILNLAVGGDWPGRPDASTPFPQTMRVDYVRIYQRRK